ncbi:MAG TPA: periplasmic heavy metal sensor [Candidatus Kryptonia bacterium]
MKSKFLVLVLSALAIAGTAWAQDSSMQKGPMRMWRSHTAGSQLKLTDSQKKDIQKIRFDLMQKQIDVRAKLSHARLDYGQLASADNPDAGALSDKIDEIAKLQTDLKKNMLDGWFAVNKLLTPDQQKIWKKVLEHPAMAMRRMRTQRVIMNRRSGQGPMSGEMMMGGTNSMSEDAPMMDIGTMADMWGMSDLDPLLDEDPLMSMPMLFDRESPVDPGDMQMDGPVIQRDDQQDPDQ